ncbi:MAG: cytochrome C oxidase subunit IV family protein [Saprospiraceae bacterium]
MGHLTYEQSIKAVYRGLILLGIVTLIEVFISLLAKGHIIKGAEEYKVILYISGLLIIALSLYKAYFIIYDFMHMRYEVKGLAMSVLLPTLLLVWAIIAFFQEGGSWKARRDQIKEKNAEEVEGKTQGGLSLRDDVYVLPEWRG